MATIAAMTVLIFLSRPARAEWKPAAGSLMTPWADKVDPAHPLPEYPRPQLERKEWVNLNGLWEYAITGKEAAAPEHFDGQILVPYPIESALSGVRKPLKATDRLWYRRSFAAPALSGGKHCCCTSGPWIGRPTSPSTARRSVNTKEGTTLSRSTSPMR